ncbi:GNAT family N-acetyltransferase [Brevibacillus sp. GCM10020057]|uniref:GNAT family N-acetyltransferase n=1 Tax=Brevibacillus sp. GCM10020057 TaxID=3317327 RepID=UPI00363FAFB6
MNEFIYANGYSAEGDKREALYPLFEKVFGIPADDLRDFYSRGFWDPTYWPYTWFDGTRAVANASRFTLELQCAGQRVQAAGIQSVMTHPDYRKRGLMRRLCERMLADADRQFSTAWLFTETPELYIPFGFRTVPQYSFAADWIHPGNPHGWLRRIDFSAEQDVQLIRKCFAGQEPLSQTFAPVGYESSFFLHMYSPSFQQNVYYSERLDAILVFAVEEQTLHLYDIIGKRLPSWAKLCEEIREPFARAVLHFCPDQFAELSFTPLPYEGTGKLMVRGLLGQELEQGMLRMPMTAAF